METEYDPVAIARRIYEQLQDETLAGTPLSGMAQWMASGAPPSAADLRAAGFCRDAEPGTMWRARKAFIRHWGFAIPCREVVDAVRTLSPIVEIGAGSGFWSALLGAAGIDIVATDQIAEGTPGYGLTVGGHTKIEALPATAAVEHYRDRNVFCSWPTQGDEWCAEAVGVMRGGRSLALIAQPRGGNTGTDALYDTLERDFVLMNHVEIPQFPNVRDVFTVHRKC